VNIKPELLLNSICEALEIDKDKLLIKKQGNQKYRDARLIVSHVFRQRLFTTKVIYGSIGEGKRANIEVDQPITYREIATILQRTKPQTAMASELACKDLLCSSKEFKAKYDAVIKLIDKNGI
jgi:hypothetical protein